jgi:hypothetical protein
MVLDGFTRRTFFSGIVFLALFRPQALVAERPSFDLDLQAGAECKIPVTALHPTQMSVGRREVHLRADKMRNMKTGKLDKYLDEHIVPIVIGPRGAPTFSTITTSSPQ